MQTWAMLSSRIEHRGYPKFAKHQSDNVPPRLSSRCFFAPGVGPIALPSQNKFHVHRFVLGSVVPCGEKLIRPRHVNLLTRFTTFRCWLFRHPFCCNRHACFYLSDSRTLPTRGDTGGPLCGAFLQFIYRDNGSGGPIPIPRTYSRASASFITPL